MPQRANLSRLVASRSVVATQPSRDDIQPVAHETRDRIITGLVTGLPVIGLAFACWQVWGGVLHWSDVVVFFVVYALTGFGVTVGFHRLLTHRAFESGPAVRFALAAL